MKKFDRVEIACIIAVALMVVFAGFTCLSFLTEGTVNAEVTEPNDVYAGKIHADPSAQWAFQGTICTECNYVYNYDEYPKVCTKCGKQTKDYYYSVLIKDRN